MVLSFGQVDWKGTVPVPERMLNGGLYVGESFLQGSPWANTPIEPDAHVYMGGYTSMPEAARNHMPGYTRPGNNFQQMPAARVFDNVKYSNMQCGIVGPK